MSGLKEQQSEQSVGEELKRRPMPRLAMHDHSLYWSTRYGLLVHGIRAAGSKRFHVAMAGEGSAKVCGQVIDLEDGQRVILLGTVFKDMPLRPSVLDEYREEAALVGEPLTTA